MSCYLFLKGKRRVAEIAAVSFDKALLKIKQSFKNCV